MGGKDSPLDGQPLPVAAQIYRSLLLPGQRNHGYGPSLPWTADKLFSRNPLGLQGKTGTVEAFSLMIWAETRIQNVGLPSPYDVNLIDPLCEIYTY